MKCKIILFVMMMASLIGLVSAEAVLFLDPAYMEIENGTEFEINVSVREVVDLYGFQFDVNYDSGILEYVGIEEGEFLKSDGASTFPLGPDNSTLGFLDNYLVTRMKDPGNYTYGVNGSGVLAKIKFKAKTSGVSDITVSGSKLVDSNADTLNHTVENSKVNVTSNFSEIIDVSLNPSNADFGSLDPSESRIVNTIVNNTLSNVAITVDSVGLLNGGTIFDGLLFNGQVSGSFVSITVNAGETGLIILTLNVPSIMGPGIQEDVIVYTITGMPPGP